MKKVLSLIVGLIIFSFLPIIGWGVADISGFTQNPFRVTFIVMMAILSVFVVILVPNEGRGYGDGKKIVKRQKLTILILQIVPLLVTIFSPFMDRHQITTFGESSAIRVLGLLLSFLGFVLMNWSIMVLGKQFSVNVTIQDDHKLITNGPYKYIRHPRYSGVIVFLIGIPIVYRTWLPLIVDILLIEVLLWRIKDEEKLMHQEFKSDWENYRRKTYSLIPFLF